MTALRTGSKCSHTKCMLRFFIIPRLALNPNIILEIGSIVIVFLGVIDIHAGNP